jgi:undecaprenyl-diphosphatase
MEASIILKLQELFASGVGKLFIIFAARWLIYFYLAFGILIRFGNRLKLMVFEAAWTALVAFTMSALVASLVDRVRPYLAVKGVVALVPPNIQAGSFPSSHTAVAVGIAAALFSAHPPSGAAALIMAALIAFGRVAVGMHYPSDVIGGAVVGMLAFLIVRGAAQGLARL